VIERQELLAGKVAVVYGAAGSMGGAVSRAFARAGAHVELAGHTFEKVDAIARELSKDGARARAAKIDALDRESVEKHLEDVVRTHGRVDISFNLIGLGDAQGALLASMKAADFVQPIEAAMRTQFLTTTAAAQHMVKARSGVILALTAQVTRKPYEASGGFGVACAAIEALCRQLAVELGPQGVRVVALRSAGSPDAPGVSREAFEARIAEKTMLRRMPRMAEGANAAVLMASDQASAVTAAVLNLTCGEIAD
jgi:NAD(P)-dependent dehydrogenase (short-subunit alcohol dehydrogenase family)